MKFIAMFFLTAIILNSCERGSSNKAVGTIIYVNSSKIDCQGEGESGCLQIKEVTNNASQQWEKFEGNITGFDYEPGYIYKISVKKEKLDMANVPAEVPLHKYSLLEVIEKNLDTKLLLNDIWALKAIDEVEIDAQLFNKQLVIEINIPELKFSGNDGCNSLFGSIATLDENKLSFGSIGATKMACPNMELPTKYTQALEKTKTYKLEDLSLRFFDAQGNELLRYQKVD